MTGVRVEGLVKAYGSTTAVAGLDLVAPAGLVTAVLGPNGAGKTTTVEICEGLRTRDGGSVSVLGLDPGDRAQHRQLRSRVGVMPQTAGAYPGARAEEMLRLVASYFQDPADVDGLLTRLGLDDVRKTAWRRLSGGQQQRLSLALAVVGRPELVFLDEPGAGLDVQARHATWDLVRELRTSGVTVVLTTHDMDEATALADHVVVVDHGRAVASGSVEQLTGTDALGQVRFRSRSGLDLEQLLRALPDGAAAKESPSGSYLIECHVDPLMLATLTSWAAGSDAMLQALQVENRTLEDVFLELTGKALR